MASRDGDGRAGGCGRLDEARPSTVLELACGTGLFTRHIAPRVAAVTAVDASPEVIEINRGRVAAANVRYVEADLFAFEPERDTTACS